MAEWRQGQDGRWQYLASDGYWYFGDPSPPPPVEDEQWADEEEDENDWRPRRNTMPVGAWIAIIAGLLAMVSAFLPWLSASGDLATIARNGFQLGTNEGFSVEGVVAVVLGVITVGIGISRLTNSDMPGWLQRSPIITGVGLVWLFVSEIGDAVHWERSINDARPQLLIAQVGVGLILLAISAGLALVGGLVLIPES